MNERDREKLKVKNTYEENFDENSPRPPVPGEERTHPMSDWGSRNQMEWSKHKPSSPVPRKCYHTNEPCASMGFEPEGSCRSSRPLSRHERSNATPPACLQWAYSLHRLLEDSDGVQLFRQFLQAEGQPHADALDFWFACEGLRKRKEPERVHQLVKAIYRRFFLKSALPISEELRREIGRRVKSLHEFEPTERLFDEAQTQIEYLISNTTYPNFIKSDMYLQYVQSVQNPSNNSEECSSESSSSISPSRDLLHLASSGSGPLPTLHEDIEFIPNYTSHFSHTPGTGCVSTGYHTPNVGRPLRLTKDMLLVTQQRRALDVQPKPEAFAGKYMYRGLGAHVAYNSYNPVSRQDSELQSLSSHSDARTESDNMSLTDSSVDGKSCRLNRMQAAMQKRQVQELAALNKETNMHQTLIPRTQRVDSRQYQSMDPPLFARVLTEKLEKVKREQESQDMLNKKLLEGDTQAPGCSEDKTTRSGGSMQSRELANAIREKLLVDDDNDQDILDQHVSRVFSDLTPTRTSGAISPRPYSPNKSYLRLRRKDKDGVSTFSSDSGNVHDYVDSFEHKISMVKSKSMPEYPDERFLRGMSNRRSSKKTLTDLTDSGVSVVSDTPPVVHGNLGKESRVLAWIMESDRGGKGAGHTHSEMSAKHSRHRKAYSGSRSSSLERTSATSSLGPAQPFVADPSMPPLPSPNTAIQLEEARRRLEDDVRTNKQRQRSSSKYLPEATQSSQSTLRKSARNVRVLNQQIPPSSEDVTTVVFSFCDEQFPYRTKIPGRQITLKQFKEYLPKKGNYRYFFKTECEELGNQVIQEEVSNDADVIPLWEGKIMAQVKSVD